MTLAKFRLPREYLPETEAISSAQSLSSSLVARSPLVKDERRYSWRFNTERIVCFRCRDRRSANRGLIYRMQRNRRNKETKMGGENRTEQWITTELWLCSKRVIGFDTNIPAFRSLVIFRQRLEDAPTALRDPRRVICEAYQDISCWFLVFGIAELAKSFVPCRFPFRFL